MQGEVQSPYTPYWGKIQELLFNGKSLQETYDYMEKYFHVGRSYTEFWWYIKDTKLYWIMPGMVTMDKPPAQRPHTYIKPSGCTFPNCFECKYSECQYDGELGKKTPPEKLYKMAMNAR